ncbi:MAG: nucleotidyltransferase family protein [Gammaproteobacteria bacterium]
MSRLPVGVLLAAGQSKRFGSNKLLQPVNNIPMLLVSAKKLLDVLPESVAVINKTLMTYKPELEQLGMKVVINEQAEQGMGSSIAHGVSASEAASGWLIALADMPYIKTETISLLADKLKEGASIVAPQFNQKRGHPVGFNKSYKAQLLALRGDVGARHIIARHQDQLELVTINDPGVRTDIDKQDDLL